MRTAISILLLTILFIGCSQKKEGSVETLEFKNSEPLFTVIHDTIYINKDTCGAKPGDIMYRSKTYSKLAIGTNGKHPIWKGKPAWFNTSDSTVTTLPIITKGTWSPKKKVFNAGIKADKKQLQVGKGLILIGGTYLFIDTNYVQIKH